MSPLGRRHRACVILLTRLLVLAVGTDGLVNPGGPVELDSHSELEPDLVVLRFREDAYRDSPSTPADVLLLIEVSDSGLGFDRGRKAAAYSRSGIDEYWIVDLVHEEVLVMRHPGPEGYGSVESYRRGQAPSPRALPHVVVPVADVLGPLP
jgi:Uma2 family endonuclease